MAISKLFPDILDARGDYLKRLQTQFSSASSPYEKMGLAIGNIAAKAFGVEDPALKQASDIQDIYSKVAQQFPDQNSPEFYAELAKAIPPEYATAKQTALEKAQEVAAAVADRNAKTAKAGREAKKAELDELSFFTKNPDQASIELQRLAAVLESNPNDIATLDRYQKIATAGTTGAIERSAKEAKDAAELAKAGREGGVKVSEISGVVGQVRASAGPLKQRLSDISTARSYADQARRGNAKGSAQLDRFLATVAGDKQLSQAEVLTVANSAGFGQRVVDAVNKFFEGTPSNMSIQEKEDVLNVIEIATNTRYNQERSSFLQSYGSTPVEYVVNANMPAVSLSRSAVDYMKRNTNTTAAGAPKPLSPNASKYLAPPAPRANPAISPSSVPSPSVVLPR